MAGPGLSLLLLLGDSLGVASVRAGVWRGRVVAAGVQTPRFGRRVGVQRLPLRGGLVLASSCRALARVGEVVTVMDRGRPAPTLELLLMVLLLLLLLKGKLFPVSHPGVARDQLRPQSEKYLCED